MDRITRDLWKRDKDGANKEQRSFIRFAIIATVVFVLFMFLKKDNVITWINAGITLKSQRRQIEQLEQSNALLDKQIEDLGMNRDSLERFARENYFFAAPGEDVYILGDR